MYKTYFSFITSDSSFVQVDNFFIDEYPHENEIVLYSLISNFHETEKVILGKYSTDKNFNYYELIERIHEFLKEQTSFQRGLIDIYDCKFGQVFKMPKENELGYLN
mgnify:CR=1 FL=1